MVAPRQRLFRLHQFRTPVCGGGDGLGDRSPTRCRKPAAEIVWICLTDLDNPHRLDAQVMDYRPVLDNGVAIFGLRSLDILVERY